MASNYYIGSLSKHLSKIVLFQIFKKNPNKKDCDQYESSIEHAHLLEHLISKKTFHVSNNILKYLSFIVLALE